MKRAFRIILRLVLILLVVAIVVGIWQRERLARLYAVTSLFAEDQIVANFSAMDTMFETTVLPRGDGAISPLPAGDPMELPPGIETWMDARAVTSLLVLKDGAIVAEEYRLGTGEADRRISWSVAKSFLSVLLGIVHEEGQIESLDDPVTQYAPELVGSAYDSATIRDVLQMSSGVVFNEDYLDFWSDINRMGRVLAVGTSMDSFAAGLTETEAEPGARWKYVSIDTHVLSMVIRGATGRTVVDLMSDKIIRPLGLEADPYYVTDGYGVAFVLGGLNLTTRDYARFAQMVADGGVWNGTRIVSQAWLDESTVPSAPTATGRIRYGYQWWMPNAAPDGVVMARGVYGQYLWIDRAAGVVIVTTGADRAFTQAGVFDSNVAAFMALSESAAR